MKLQCVLVLEMCLVDAGPGREHFGCSFFKLIAYLPVSVSVTSKTFIILAFTGKAFAVSYIHIQSLPRFGFSSSN